MATYVFLALINELNCDGSIRPREREDEILSCSNARVRAQKDGVWRLLLQGANFVYGTPAQELAFRKETNGKWTCPAFHFSLSHSGRSLAVAISDRAVGADIEELPNAKLSQKLYDKIVCGNEKKGDASDRDVAALWTKKEAIFKRDRGAVFRPERLDTAAEMCASFVWGNAVVSVTDGDIQVYHVCNERIKPLEVFIL